MLPPRLLLPLPPLLFTIIIMIMIMIMIMLMYGGSFASGRPHLNLALNNTYCSGVALLAVVILVMDFHLVCGTRNGEEMVAGHRM